MTKKDKIINKKITHLAKTDAYRRKFLQAVTVVGATVLAPNIKLIELAQARPDGEPVSKKVRWGLLIDTQQCSKDCNHCVKACQQENGWGLGSGDEHQSNDEQKAKWIRKVDMQDKQSGFELSLPLMCQHCEQAPCVDVCPTGASFKRDDGIVLVDKHRCIGCRYCMIACPYQARSFIHEPLYNQRSHTPRGKGTVESCTLCVHRIDRDQQPACVQACNQSARGAMHFGDLNDANSDISQTLQKIAHRQIREDLRLNTAVRYRGF